LHSCIAAKATHHLQIFELPAMEQLDLLHRQAMASKSGRDYISGTEPVTIANDYTSDAWQQGFLQKHNHRNEPSMRSNCDFE
jgi:hypothetical protein